MKKLVVIVMMMAVTSVAAAQTPPPVPPVPAVVAPAPPVVPPLVVGAIRGHEVRVSELEKRVAVLEAAYAAAKAQKGAFAQAKAARLQRELAAAEVELTAARQAAREAVAVDGTVKIVQTQVGSTTIVNPPPPANPALPAPAGGVALPTVHSDRCAGHVVSATAGPMYTYYECEPTPPVSVTRPITEADKDPPKKSAGWYVGSCLIGAAVGAGVAMAGPGIGRIAGHQVDGADYGIAAGVGAGAGCVLGALVYYIAK